MSELHEPVIPLAEREKILITKRLKITSSKTIWPAVGLIEYLFVVRLVQRNLTILVQFNLNKYIPHNLQT